MTLERIYDFCMSCAAPDTSVGHLTLTHTGRLDRYYTFTVGVVVVCGDLFFLCITADKAGVGLYALFLTGRLGRYLTAVKLMRAGLFGSAIDTESVDVAVLGGDGNSLGHGLSADADFGKHTLGDTGSRLCYHAGIELVGEELALSRIRRNMG